MFCAHITNEFPAGDWVVFNACEEEEEESKSCVGKYVQDIELDPSLLMHQAHTQSLARGILQFSRFSHMLEEAQILSGVALFVSTSNLKLNVEKTRVVVF